MLARNSQQEKPKIKKTILIITQIAVKFSQRTHNRNVSGYQYQNYQFAVAELSVWGALPEGVSGEPTEDPVKNGTCPRPVRHL